MVHIDILGEDSFAAGGRVRMLLLFYDLLLKIMGEMTSCFRKHRMIIVTHFCWRFLLGPELAAFLCVFLLFCFVFLNPLQSSDSLYEI